MAANQKIVLSAAVFAAILGLVACQSLDPQLCAQNVQGAARQAREEYQQILNQLMTEMSKEASQAANMERVNSSFTRLIELASSLANTEGGLNAQRLQSTLSEMARTYMELTRTMMSAQPSINMMRAMMRAFASSTATYTNFVMRVPEKCTP